MTKFKLMNNCYWKLVNHKTKGKIWENKAGGYHHFNDDDLNEYPIKESTKWPAYEREDSLDMLRETVRNGWINRRGWFYGCEFMNHDAFARLVLQKSVRTLEADGWVRVHPEFFQFGLETLVPTARITKAQEKTLFEIGFLGIEDNYGMRRQNDIPEYEDVKDRIKINKFVEKIDA